MLVVANLFGLVSFLAFAVSMFRKTKKDMVCTHIICNVCDMFQYIILSGWNGLVEAIISLFGNIAFVKKDSKITYGVVNLIRIIVLILTWQGVISFFMISKVVISCICVLFLSEQCVRISSVYTQSIWCVYDFTEGAYISSICDIITVIIVIVSIYKNSKFVHS